MKVYVISSFINQENNHLFSMVCNLMQVTSPAVRHGYRKREFTLAAIQQYIIIDDVYIYRFILNAK